MAPNIRQNAGSSSSSSNITNIGDKNYPDERTTSNSSNLINASVDQDNDDDAYIAGMSSDTELSTRRHTGQRLYYAHPSPHQTRHPPQQHLTPSRGLSMQARPVSAYNAPPAAGIVSGARARRTPFAVAGPSMSSACATGSAHELRSLPHTNAAGARRLPGRPSLEYSPPSRGQFAAQLLIQQQQHQLGQRRATPTSTFHAPALTSSPPPLAHVTQLQSLHQQSLSEPLQRSDYPASSASYVRRQETIDTGETERYFSERHFRRPPTERLRYLSLTPTHQMHPMQAQTHQQQQRQFYHKQQVANYCDKQLYDKMAHLSLSSSSNQPNSDDLHLQQQTYKHQRALHQSPARAASDLHERFTSMHQPSTSQYYAGNQQQMRAGYWSAYADTNFGQELSANGARSNVSGSLSQNANQDQSGSQATQFTPTRQTFQHAVSMDPHSMGSGHHVVGVSTGSSSSVSASRRLQNQTSSGSSSTSLDALAASDPQHQNSKLDQSHAGHPYPHPHPHPHQSQSQSQSRRRQLPVPGAAVAAGLGDCELHKLQLQASSGARNSKASGAAQARAASVASSELTTSSQRVAFGDDSYVNRSYEDTYNNDDDCHVCEYDDGGVSASLATTSTTKPTSASAIALTGTTTSTRKSLSATQLSTTGTKKRLGFRKKQLTSFSVHRSEEVVPNTFVQAQLSSSSSTSTSASASASASANNSNSTNNKNKNCQTHPTATYISGPRVAAPVRSLANNAPLREGALKIASSVSISDSSLSGDNTPNTNFKTNAPIASTSTSTTSTSNKQPPNTKTILSSNLSLRSQLEADAPSCVDGLGKGQIISRHELVSPYLGDLELSLCDRRGNLDIEVIQGCNLVQKQSSKHLPFVYVKLYLVKQLKCLAKAKTGLSNKRTLNPSFYTQLTFHEDYRGCILQAIVWGNYSKIDKKCSMGVAQISLDDLDLGDTVVSWYKLFLPSTAQTMASKSLRHTLLSTSTESFATSNSASKSTN